MQGEILEEHDDWIGVQVVDNGSATHKIAVEVDDGEIRGHNQDGYPDDSSKRTTEEHEWVNQAQRFARFYVYRQRGYETVEPLSNPDRIATAAMAIANLPDDTFEEYFGGFYQQMLHDAGEADPIVSVPELPPATVPRVEQDIYLGMDDQDTAALLDQFISDGVMEAVVSAVTQTSGNGGLISRVQDAFTDQDIDITDSAEAVGVRLIDAVGPVTIRWAVGDTDEEVSETTTEPLPDRGPDARPQMFGRAYEFDDIEAFRNSLVRHLFCQVRDCYITMGIAPPEEMRIQGPGFYDNLGWYSNHDFYQNYHDVEATITDWQEDQTPEDAYDLTGLLEQRDKHA